MHEEEFVLGAVRFGCVSRKERKDWRHASRMGMNASAAYSVSIN